MHQLSRQFKREGKLIGLVPTMGYLHEGHISLIKKSKELTDITIVSIFVNPTQFSPNEDLLTYPRDLDRDKKVLSDIGIDFVFLPSNEEIYSQGFQTYVSVDNITKKYEGEFRPTHFKGVTTIVLILFNCIKPDYAFFGQKDAQQSAAIKQMVNDLKYDIQLVICPIIREKDGLAMSSRNIYLSIEERKKALLLFKSLLKAKELMEQGEREVKKILKSISSIFLGEKTIHINYISIVNAETFSEIEWLEGKNNYYVLIAAKIGKTRLIDNILINL